MGVKFINIFVLIVICGVLFVNNVECGRTIKKYSANIKTPVEGEDDGYIPTKPIKGKSALVQKEVKEEDSTEEVIAPKPVSTKRGNRNCTTLEDGTVQCQKMKPTSAVVTNPNYAVAPAGWHYPQRPLSMFDLYWRHRMRKTGAPQTSMTAQRIQPFLQKATFDMAKGILTGMGWDLEDWELDLLESITKKVTRNFMFIFQFLF